ncbi:hypothetical protein MTJW_01980 [Moorella thermoacetica]|nr:hypothetical protein MTJW_01980 [Moorella thermoacetica]
MRARIVVVIDRAGGYSGANSSRAEGLGGPLMATRAATKYENSIWGREGAGGYSRSLKPVAPAP